MATFPLSAKAVFDEAVEMASPEERRAYLERACADAPAVRQEVEALLAAYAEAGSFLESPPAPPCDSIDLPPAAEQPGTMIGPFKLLQQIGEGGMGVVWMAEQTHPVQRKVALKVIKPGMDSKQVVARFEAERQALAVMDHVNIARVCDGGTTAAGLPYFVMELVHGVPITKYCDDNQLTPRERLELFVPVCQAIQHAHQKGIIHRDIKPSNVMVTLYDGRPVPKVIDFGVAKATEQKLSDRTLFTQCGTLVGTLEYMSPEQAETSALGVDTRSDIFSLGVLLYELLTGSTPLTHRRMKQAAHAELLRLIKEEEPPKPSTRLSDSGDDLASISANRHTEPARLTKLLRGDLDWILMKCLEKDRTRRYETANGLAADIQRHLNDETVTAGAPSAGHRLRKFVKRNRARVIAAGIVAGALVLGVVGTTSGMIWALDEKERASTAFERAEANLVLALKALDQIYVDEAKGHPKIREGLPRDLLERGLGFYQEFARQNAHHEYVARWMGNAQFNVSRIFRTLGQTVRADEDLDRAISTYREAIRLKPDDAELHLSLGIALLDRGDMDGAIASSREAIRLEPDHMRAHCNLGNALGKGDIEGAIASYREAIRLDPSFADAHYNIACLLHKVGDMDGAIASYREAIRLKPDDTASHGNLAGLLRAKGDVDGAIASSREAIRLDPGNAEAHSNLGTALLAKGDLDGALASCREAVRLKLDYAPAHCNLGSVLSAKGDIDGAIASYREAIRLEPDFFEVYVNLGHTLTAKGDIDGALASCREAVRLKPDYAEAHFNLGNALDEKGDLDGALASYREVIRLKPDCAKAHCNVGYALNAKGDLVGAIASYREAIRFDPVDFVPHFNLGNALRDTRDIEGAVAPYREAIRLKPDHAESHYSLGNMLMAKGDPDGAIASFREAMRLKADYAEPHCNLGHTLTRQGHFREALPWLRKGHEIGSKRADWAYPSKEWIEHAERMAELEGRLDQVLSGGERPSDAVEGIAFAELLYAKSRHVESARMYAEAFAEDEALAEDLAKNNRYNAACSAALAAARGETDAAQCRGRALEWLRADLAARERAATGLVATLEHWKGDRDLAGVRDRTGDLPESERAAWQGLWAAVDGALATARQTSR